MEKEPQTQNTSYGGETVAVYLSVEFFFVLHPHVLCKGILFTTLLATKDDVTCGEALAVAAAAWVFHFDSMKSHTMGYIKTKNITELWNNILYSFSRVEVKYLKPPNTVPIVNSEHLYILFIDMYTTSLYTI